MRSMLLEMLKMSLDSIPSLWNYVFRHDLCLIIRPCLYLFDGYRSLRAMAYAGSKTVAEQVADKPCLAVDYPQRPFLTVWHTKPAPVAFFFVDIDYCSFHFILSIIWARIGLGSLTSSIG